MKNSIAGELALVTGSGSGIGQALALRLAQLGADVILVGRTAAKLEQTANSIAQLSATDDVTPGKAHIMACDITDADAITDLVKTVEKDFGHLDILVNNAGVLVSKTLEETTTEELDAILSTNIRAPYLLCREFLPLLRTSKAAEIINICSTVAHVGYAQQSAYAASKHALLGMSQSLAREVYEEGIRVHVISPGGVLTDMIAEARPDLAGVPMIVPDDIADALEFFVTHRTDGVIDEIRVHRSTKEPF